MYRSNLWDILYSYGTFYTAKPIQLSTVLQTKEFSNELSACSNINVKKGLSDKVKALSAEISQFKCEPTGKGKNSQEDQNALQ